MNVQEELLHCPLALALAVAMAMTLEKISSCYVMGKDMSIYISQYALVTET